MARAVFDDRIDEYWMWITGVMFLLITVDMLTTLYATAIHGTAAEANPLMVWLLHQGLVELVLVNLLATTLVTILFYGLVRLIRESEPPFDRMLCLFVEVWLGILCSVGLAVFANNILVIFFSRSLI